jgi:hypothetical protein
VGRGAGADFTTPVLPPFTPPFTLPIRNAVHTAILLNHFSAELPPPPPCPPSSSQVGSILRVMVDRMDGTDAVGRTEFDAIDIDGTVRIPAMPLAPGTVVRARIVAADGLDLIAEIVR